MAVTATIDVSYYTETNEDTFIYNTERVFDFVINELKKMRPCGNNNNNNSKIIDIAVVSDLVKYSNYFLPMKVVECLFDNLLFRSQLKDQLREHLWQLHSSKSDWGKRTQRLSSGSYGITLTGTLFNNPDIKFVIKQSRDTNLDAIKLSIVEYFTGCGIVNNFRKYCPNYCYTLGSFLCGDMKDNTGKLCDNNKKPITPVLCYEYIDGTTFNSAIGVIPLITQLLLALEIGQREARFCHYDLSVDNVMVTKQSHKFSILLDDKEFRFDSPIAKIIDYGMSCAKYKGKTIFSSNLPPKYRRNGYLVQGFDALMFLISAYEYSNNYIDKELIKIALDTILDIDSTKFIKDIKSKVADIYYANIMDYKFCSMSPMVMLTRMLTNQRIRDALLGKMEIIPRKTLDVIESDSIFKFYNKIFRDILPLDISCVDEYGSYLMAYEVMMELERSRTFDNKRLKLRSDLGNAEIATRLKLADESMIEGYFNIKIKAVTPIAEKILTLSINPPFNWRSIRVFKEFINDTKFITEIESYINIYYLINQLGLEGEKPYDRLVRAIESRHETYAMYLKLHPIITPARRWAQTLIDSEEYSKKGRMFAIR